MQVGARLRGFDVAGTGGDRAPVVAALQHHFAGDTAQQFVVLVFEAADALLVHVHRADHRPSQADPRGFESSRLLQPEHTLQFEFGHCMGNVIGHHPGQIGMLVGLAQELVQPPLIHVEHWGQGGGCGSWIFHLAGVGPDGPLRYRNGERHPIAVEDLAPVSGQLDCF